MTALPAPPGLKDPRLRMAAVYVGCACLVAAAAVLLDWRLLVAVALGLPLLAVTLLRETSGERLASRGVSAVLASSPLHRERFVAATWVFLLLSTTLRIIEGTRSVTAASSGSLSADIGLELASMAVAGLVVASLFAEGWSLPLPRMTLLLGGYAVWATLSVTWSRIPLLSMVRAMEFAVLALFTMYTAGRAADDPEFFRRVLHRVVRYLTFASLGLAAYGVATGGLGLERFTWKGTHPNSAATVLLVPCLALLFHSNRSAITRPVPWWAPPMVLLPLVYATGSRATVGAGAAAVVAGFVVAGLRDSRVGAFGLGVGLTVAGTGAAIAADRLAAFLFRGQSLDTVIGLNGRVETWSWVLANPLGNEVWGIGIGGARGALSHVSWNPTNVHNAWIDVLQTLGVIGLSMMGAFVLAVLALALIRRSVYASWAVVFVIVSSVNSITIAQPGYMLVLLCLSAVVVSAAAHTSAVAFAVGGDVPAPTGSRSGPYEDRPRPQLLRLELAERRERGGAGRA